jgi:hypothetical protein
VILFVVFEISLLTFVDDVDGLTLDPLDFDISLLLIGVVVDISFDGVEDLDVASSFDESLFYFSKIIIKKKRNERHHKSISVYHICI